MTPATALALTPAPFLALDVLHRAAACAWMAVVTQGRGLQR